MLTFWIVVAVVAGLGVMIVTTLSRTKPAPRSRHRFDEVEIYETLRIMDEHDAATCRCTGLYHECEDK